MNKDYDSSLLKLFETAKIAGKIEVQTTYVVKVLNVSADGQYVDVMHCNLEWQADPSSKNILQNSFLEEIACSPKKPWVIHDVPVERHEYGVFKMRVRPKRGDVGKMTVYYHDIASLKRLGGFQAPDIINIHSLLSCTYHPMGEIGHPQVASGEQSNPYPQDGIFEIVSPNTKIVANDNTKQVQITAGSVVITIDGNGSGISINAPETLSINAKTANITAETATLTTSGATTISASGGLDVSGSSEEKIPTGTFAFCQMGQTDSLGKPIITGTGTNG